MTTSDAVRLLLSLEARRLTDAIRHPRIGTWAAVGLPVAIAAAGMWMAGESVRPDVSTGDGVILLGLLAASPVSIQAYPILFRAPDDAFLRRLGIPARALFGVRALRLLALAVAVVLALMIPFVSTGQPAARPLAVALAAAMGAWAVSLWAQARAAVKVCEGKRNPFAGFLGPDPQLAAAASLVYAPLYPLFASAAAARFAGSEVATMPVRLAAVAVLSLALVPLAARAFARALPRFAPRAGEMAYAPPPDASGGELIVGRGIVRLLPRGVQAARARDAVVLGRRYRWASRVAWPVSIVAALALLRAGRSPDLRTAVTLACGLLLMAQAGTVIALGRAERGRLRWLDRGVGLGAANRLLGRWAAALGQGMAIALPLAFGWWLGVPGGGGWLWLAAAAGVAAVASLASLTAAGR
ncbi:MAG: hypothetical protein ACJ8GN_24460 [Longimicrobiaceae bacterium]